MRNDLFVYAIMRLYFSDKSQLNPQLPQPRKSAFLHYLAISFSLFESRRRLQRRIAQPPPHHSPPQAPLSTF
ncbi:unnamed protein product [Lathyrus oleraceus]